MIRGDILDEALALKEGRYALIHASEVTSHLRGVRALRRLFERLSTALAPGGHLLVNMFLTEPGYEPDTLAREMAELAWSTMYTRNDLADALRGLPLDCISDESAPAYERARYRSTVTPADADAAERAWQEIEAADR